MFSKKRGVATLLGFAFTLATAHAQKLASSGEVDLSLTSNSVRQSGIPGKYFWQQGGDFDLSADLFHGFGIGMSVSGATASNINNSGVNASSVMAVFGPEYTYRRKRFSLHGEGLLGESNGFGGVYPSSTGATQAFDSFATKIGGAFDLSAGRRFGLRLIQASWVRTQFPNATTNVQNSLQLGAGIVLKFRPKEVR